jgi:hypothetical protein
VLSTCWRLHDVVVEAVIHDGVIGARWQQTFSSLQPVAEAATLRVELELTEVLPRAPAREADFRQGGLIEYYLEGSVATARLPRFGQIRIDLTSGVSVGWLLPAAVSNHAAFEDLVAISLSPHLRRRGRFLVHAFAGELNGRAVLLVGPIGSGKTTAGVTLLAAGWRLLANDSPIVVRGGDVLSYPGPIAITRDTVARVGLPIDTDHVTTDEKLLIDPDVIWPGVRVDRAAVGAIVLIGVGDHEDHRLDYLTPSEALLGLLPHSVEQWDRETIPEHLKALRELVEAAPGWRLSFGSRVDALPALLAAKIAR